MHPLIQILLPTAVLYQPDIGNMKQGNEVLEMNQSEFKKLIPKLEELTNRGSAYTL